MTYDEFKITLAAQVTNLVGEEVNVNVHKIQKNNGILMDAISIMRTGVYAAPSIYLQDLYDHYEHGKNIMELAKKVIELSEERQIRGILPKDFFMDYHKIKDRICYRVINYEKNQQLLQTIPHRKVLDLAMVYCYLVEPELLENASVLIRNIDLHRWGVDADEIKARAEQNTPKVAPWHLMTMNELMEEIMDGENLHMTTEIFPEDPFTMFVLTNKEKYFGAACMFYPQVLEQIAEQIDNHFYILPSSVHECIITPVSGGFSQKTLSEMVKEINNTQVEEVDRLSDCAYFYNRDKKELVL